jgi:hypothetical protein
MIGPVVIRLIANESLASNRLFQYTAAEQPARYDSYCTRQFPSKFECIPNQHPQGKISR